MTWLSVSPHSLSPSSPLLSSRMWLLPAALLVSHLSCSAGAAVCPRTDANGTIYASSDTLQWGQLDTRKPCLNFSHQEFARINASASVGTNVIRLDLSYNRLQGLPTKFFTDSSSNLEELYLQNNSLHQLPTEAFAKAIGLKVLKLEGNPLASVPASVFHNCLQKLSVDCRCSVARAIHDHCSRPTRANCSRSTECLCASAQGFIEVTTFHDQQCHSPAASSYPKGLYAAILAPLLALLVAAGCFLIWRKKVRGTGQEKLDPHLSPGDHEPPRYVSRSSPQAERAEGTGNRTEYENIFVGQPQTARQGQGPRRGRKQSKDHR